MPLSVETPRANAFTEGIVFTGTHIGESAALFSNGKTEFACFSSVKHGMRSRNLF